MSKVPINLATSKGTGILHNQAIIANGVVYCSGQVPADMTTGEIVPGGIKEHTVCFNPHLIKVLQLIL